MFQDFIQLSPILLLQKKLESQLGMTLENAIQCLQNAVTFDASSAISSANTFKKMNGARALNTYSLEIICQIGANYRQS
jgi:hypothetical protein